MSSVYPLFSIALSFLVLYGIWRAIRGMIGKKGRVGSGNMICLDCGSVCDPGVKTRGKLGIEILLWLFFFVPGFIYSLWRISSRVDVCPACESERIVPISTPIGKKMFDGHRPEAQAPERPAPTVSRPTRTRLADDQMIGIRR